MSFQNSQLLLVSLLFIAVINPYSFYFVLNTNLFTFYITLCINIAIQLYAWIQQKHRFIIPCIPIWQNIFVQLASQVLISVHSLIFIYACCPALVNNNLYTKKQLYWQIAGRYMQCKSICSSIKYMVKIMIYLSIIAQA